MMGFPLALTLTLAGVAVAHPPGRPWQGGQGWHHGPAQQSAGSGLTIVTHDDLYGNTSSRTDSIIVSGAAVSEAQAQQACSALGEQLWSPGDVSLLEYLAYEGQQGPYWIAEGQGRGCKVIDSTGKQSSVSWNAQYPALCTNSAPLSNATNNSNGTEWQTTIDSAGQEITGFRDKHSFRFLGIKYANQPERFTYSTPLDAAGSYSALDFGSQCVQAGGVGSEDCLFLNVWTPYLPGNVSSNGNGWARGWPGEKSSSTALKPVLFWIHGGAFTGGTGSDPTFDGGAFASRGDIVVVTINYRLGTLGFLALEDGATNGNFGLADQITALEWVHSHIAAFGGDASRITIAGQSAGAASVRALLASPKAIGKYAAAVPQSNLAGEAYATTYGEWYNITEEVIVAADPVLNATGCLNATSQVNCLRALDPHAIANLTAVARFLVVDGTYLTTSELEVTGKGPTANVPVMMGIMRDDGAAFISYPMVNDTLTEFTTSQGLSVIPSVDIASLTTIFPEPTSANATLNVFNTSALISTDAQFRCLDLASAYSAALHSVFPEIYFYEFNRSYQLSFYSPNAPVCVPAPSAEHPLGDPKNEYFKCHSGELYYVFGSLAFNGLAPRDDLDIPFEQFTLDTWASFVRTHNPNPDLAFLKAKGFTNTLNAIAASGSQWTPYTTQNQQTRVLEWPAFEASEWVFAGGNEAQCDALGLPLNYYETRQ
ncbi:hypothetical protein B0A48_09295 [Cryoendolithus antarcticus]|uniref:Carboxylesterase type B domain-containing protein n=1 Tax=Cryoendolithus antarcticus TaxID=1507870 RepID=A0A1V8T270_9PEZI|nr:hypothetical protein B0A48_09295 [Cryoendolithus antarcticus]